AAKYFPNTVVYTALGDSYKATGQYKNAEEVYSHAWYMNPSRFYPKYLLAKLYDESGQLEKAAIVAGELLAKEVKVESTAVEEIKAEMQQILEAQNTGM
ncbi:MAG: tetratricopeptide repeat protein, partial [bacterium]